MGKALLIIVLALSTLFSTGMLNLNRHSLASVDEYSAHYRQMAARNAAVSGVYMSFSKLYQDSTWRSGFQNLSFNNSIVSVNIDSLSEWDIEIEATASYENVADTIDVVIRMPPELSGTAIFTTDTVINTVAWDSTGNLDSTLLVMNAPEMIPFDKNAMISIAASQPGHIINTDFEPPKDYPNGSFYYDAINNIPNVTYVQGDLTIKGGTTIYGIYIVEADVLFEQIGNSRVEGVIYMPNNGRIEFTGGGTPKDANITGGVFADGPLIGNANANQKLKVQYKAEYMKLFSKYQLSRNLYILSWTESNFY